MLITAAVGSLFALVVYGLWSRVIHIRSGYTALSLERLNPSTWMILESSSEGHLWWKYRRLLLWRYGFSDPPVTLRFSRWHMDYQGIASLGLNYAVSVSYLAVRHLSFGRAYRNPGYFLHIEEQ